MIKNICNARCLLELAAEDVDTSLQKIERSELDEYPANLAILELRFSFEMMHKAFNALQNAEWFVSENL